MKGNDKVVKTKDGSDTLHSKKYDESYHTKNGAINEAFEKFCAPCRIAEIAKGGSVSILDIGFGLGYNALCAIHTAEEANPRCEIKVISLENEIVGLDVLNGLSIPDNLKKEYEIVKAAAETKLYNEEGIMLFILQGDARQSILSVNDEFDAVFLDPFSLKKNLELWTVDFFSEIYYRMKEHAILATYSQSTPVRCGLQAAGFFIGPGPGDDMKKGGTLATKGADIIKGFSRKELEKLKSSPERFPFYDPELNATKKEIYMMREKIKNGGSL